MISYDERDATTRREAPVLTEGPIDQPVTESEYGHGTRGCLRSACRLRCGGRGGRDRVVCGRALDPRSL